MKTKRNLIQICLLCAGVSTLPATVQAQFTFTTNNGSITITGYTGSGGAVTIPATTNGLPVTIIAAGAFQSSDSVTSVMIPDSVTNIGDAAFSSCTGLTSVTIGNSVTSIGRFAFSSSSLNSVIIPDSVTDIGSYAFYYCTEMTGVTIGNSVISIGGYAFFFCSGLTQIYFKGNAPGNGLDPTVFSDDANNATVFYLPGTTGWSTTFDGVPTELWNPQVQTSSATFGVQSDQFGFTITGNSNLVIVVEASTNLANSSWTPVGTNTLNIFLGTNGTSHFSDPQLTNYPARFYRLRSP